MDVDDVAVLVCQTALVAWTVCLCLLRCGKKFRMWDKSVIVSATIRWLGEVWRWCFHASPDDERVAVYLTERRVQRMRIVAVALVIAQSLSGTVIIFNIAAGRERFYSTGMDIATIVAHLVTIAFIVWPNLLSRMPNVLYSSIMAWLALHVSPAVESIDPMVANGYFMIRMFLSMAILDMRAIVFWNVVSSIAAWCQFAFDVKDRQCGAVHVSEFTVALKELCSCILVIVICFSFKQGIVAELVERQGASASRRECGAVSALLWAMSDVVVRLDSSLRVWGDAPTLATLLLRESVREVEFEKLLFSDEDKQQFHDCIASTAENEVEVIVPWRVRLRDGVGTGVMAECFHAQLEDVAGNMFHMIGIREVQVEEKTGANGTSLAPAPRNIGIPVVQEPPSPLTPQTTPMPNEMFLELILKECNGIPTAAEREAARESRLETNIGSRKSSLSSRSNQSRGSSRSRSSSRSSRSSRSGRSGRSSQPSRLRGASRDVETGSIVKLREPKAATNVEVSTSGGGSSAKAQCLLVEL